MRLFRSIGILSLLAGLCFAGLATTAQASSEPNMQIHQMELMQFENDFEFAAMAIKKSEDVKAEFRKLDVGTCNPNQKSFDRHCSDPHGLMSQKLSKQLPMSPFDEPTIHNSFEVGWRS